LEISDEIIDEQSAAKAKDKSAERKSAGAVTIWKDDGGREEEKPSGW
jgi:hypothetical protein